MVKGYLAPGFEVLEGVFADNFRLQGDVGAACCVYHRGQVVVDIWAGLADRQQNHPWQQDTLQLVFSATKGAVAVCMLALVEQGLLDLEAPIARYWPEFAANGKDSIPVKWLLSHQAGIPKIDDNNLSLEQVYGWDKVVATIAAQQPLWQPGSQHGYHIRSWGWVCGEIIHRITGLTTGQFLQQTIAQPLRLDFWIGLPEQQEARTSTLYAPIPPEDPKLAAMLEQLTGKDTLLGQVMAGPNNLFSYGEMWNSRALHAAEIPSSNGITTARSLARMYAALIGEVDGVRLLSADTLAMATEVQCQGADSVIGLPSCFGLGFMLPPMLPEPCGSAAFGHPGAGGALGFANPESELAFAYVMNQMQFGSTGDKRSEALVEAIQKVII